MLFNKYAPCLILIDEWVAYARQLHEASDLPGRRFETHFTFAQTLSEAAKAFMELYWTQQQEFPPECRDSDYEKRLKADPDAVAEEVKTRVVQDAKQRGDFSRVHPFPPSNADSYDEVAKRYRGLRFAQHVTISEDDHYALPVKPTAAQQQFQAEQAAITGSAAILAAGASRPDAGAPGFAGQQTTQPGKPPAPPQPKRFYGSVRLNPQRVGRDAGKIAEEIVQHLALQPGATVEVTLEIHAQMPEGAPENIIRIVTENARTLKFTDQGFETE